MGTTALTTPPSLGPLYAKAGLLGQLPGRLGGRGSTLPESVYTLADQSISATHLLDYQKVCGFRVSDVLPPTYLHMLAFPLSVALMTERAFPFPLIGMVHVANTITLARPVLASETVSLTVHAEDLRPHPAGRQLDLVASATVDGEPVWSSRSAYLRRGGAPAAEKPAAPRASAPPAGVPALVKVPDSIGRQYGAVSGDRNPIHLYGITAKAFGFPSAIAHGMWLKARTLAALEGRIPDACTIDVAFKTPVLLPATIAISAIQSPQGWALDVRNPRNGKPHLAGTIA